MSRPEDDVRDLPKPADIAGALEEAVQKLHPLGSDFALIGGVALSFYGIERYTKDVDLAVTLSLAGAAQEALKDQDPLPLRVGGVSIRMSSGVRVDLIDRRVEYRALFEEAIDAAKTSKHRARVGAFEVPVISLPYLIALKLAADRPVDELDIQALLSREDLDYPITRELIRRHFGYFVLRRLDRMARAAHRKDAPGEYENGDSPKYADQQEKAD